jgi:hypothetical protein
MFGSIQGVSDKAAKDDPKGKADPGIGVKHVRLDPVE